MINSTFFSVASGSETQVIAPLGNNLMRIRIVGLTLSFAGALNAYLTTGTVGSSTQISNVFYATANFVGYVLPIGPATMALSGFQGWFEGNTGAGINIFPSAATAVTGTILWIAVN